MNTDQYGVDMNDLRPEELIAYQALRESVDKNQLTTDKIREQIYAMKSAVEDELFKASDTPQTWLSALSLFIPIIGIMRKWYQDQKKMALEARLKNYQMIYGLFIRSDAIAKELDRQVINLRNAQAKARETLTRPNEINY